MTYIPSAYKNPQILRSYLRICMCEATSRCLLGEKMRAEEKLRPKASKNDLHIFFLRVKDHFYCSWVIAGKRKGADFFNGENLPDFGLFRKLQ